MKAIVRDVGQVVDPAPGVARQRSPTIRLAASESRCDPVDRPCAARTRCVRFRAALVRGIPAKDFSATNQWSGTVLCDQYMDLRGEVRRTSGGGS